MKTVITFGTFDVFHIGHLNILLKAGALGERLVVGISSDSLNQKKKGRSPLYSQEERMAIVSNIKGVDTVFLEESLEAKADYILYHHAHVLAMGDDWAGRFDHLRSLCDVVYFPRTPSISTTSIIEIAKSVP